MRRGSSMRTTAASSITGFVRKPRAHLVDCAGQTTHQPGLDDEPNALPGAEPRSPSGEDAEANARSWRLADQQLGSRLRTSTTARTSLKSSLEGEVRASWCCCGKCSAGADLGRNWRRSARDRLPNLRSGLRHQALLPGTRRRRAASAFAIVAFHVRNEPLDLASRLEWRSI